MSYLTDVWNAQVEVWREQLGDGRGDLERDECVQTAKERRHLTVCGHGPQPGTPGGDRAEAAWEAAERAEEEDARRREADYLDYLDDDDYDSDAG